jgi:hypothetical protein
LHLAVWVTPKDRLANLWRPGLGIHLGSPGTLMVAWNRDALRMPRRVEFQGRGTLHFHHALRVIPKAQMSRGPFRSARARVCVCVCVCVRSN